MEKLNLHIIDWLLSSGRSIAPLSAAEPKTSSEFVTFRQTFFRESEAWAAPIDRAVAGGFIADCFAYAFAAGYCSALQSLVPTVPENTVTCFCISEEGGGHPRAIQSQLTPLANDADQTKTYILNGKKKYITCAKEADLFIVAASEGIRDNGKNSIRMMKIDSKTPGIEIVPMTNIHLVPEISHCELIFTDVVIAETDLLPGDGYADYIKPFRTVEDLHISAGLLGYLFKNACCYDWGTDIKERILGCIVSVRNPALNDPASPLVHILTGDVLKQIKELFTHLEPLWETIGGKIKDDWDRDKMLMMIADKARNIRLKAAWAFFEDKTTG